MVRRESSTSASSSAKPALRFARRWGTVPVRARVHLHPPGITPWARPLRWAIAHERRPHGRVVALRGGEPPEEMGVGCPRGGHGALRPRSGLRHRASVPRRLPLADLRDLCRCQRSWVPSPTAPRWSLAASGALGLAASFLFFLTSNFGAWLIPEMNYPRTLGPVRLLRRRPPVHRRPSWPT